MAHFARFGGPIRPIAVAAPFTPSSGSRSSSGSVGTLRLMSWNLLAPPYNRREQGPPDAAAEEWRPRALAQLSLVAEALPDIVGLQEFWSANESFVLLWRDFADRFGYVMHVVPRVDSKSDGCCLLVRLPPSKCSFSGFTYDDWGSRILQMAELRVNDATPPLVLMQTHLTFPHRSEHDPPMRYQQARKISDLISELWKSRGAIPTCIFGDLNGNQDDPAVTLLTESGGLRPMPPPTRAQDSVRDEPEPLAHPHKSGWITHVAHTGAHMACDLVLTRGDCCVREWTLGGSESALVAGCFVSDHLPVIATLVLDRTEIAEMDGTHRPLPDEGPESAAAAVAAAL